MKQSEYTPVYVEQMPKIKEEGKLYISHEFGLSIHLCACGCGGEAVMSIKPHWKDGWTMTEEPEGVTFAPSILNRFCKAHYYIRKNKVVWC